ncbi:MAG: single-stranded DNA-binding protein [Culicoidibacterales bacterium]
MINRATLVGRITKDPELRYTSNNVASVSFTIAVNRTFTNQAGEREADFVPCIAWRKQAENLANFVRKGALIGIDGRLQTRTYDAQDGSKRFVMEVVADSVQFLESRGSRQDANAGQYGQQQQQPMMNQGMNNMGMQQQQQPFVQQQQQQPMQQPVQQPAFESHQEFNFNQPQPIIDISDDDLPF